MRTLFLVAILALLTITAVREPNLSLSGVFEESIATVRELAKTAIPGRLMKAEQVPAPVADSVSAASTILQDAPVKLPSEHISPAKGASTNAEAVTPLPRRASGVTASFAPPDRSAQVAPRLVDHAGPAVRSVPVRPVQSASIGVPSPAPLPASAPVNTKAAAAYDVRNTVDPLRSAEAMYREARRVLEELK